MYQYGCCFFSCFFTYILKQDLVIIIISSHYVFFFFLSCYNILNDTMISCPQEFFYSMHSCISSRIMTKKKEEEDEDLQSVFAL